MTDSERGYKVVMPKLGLTMTEATIIEWSVADGEHAEKGETLFILESEKSTLEIEAPASGVLRILVQAGETIAVHKPIAILVGAEPASATPASGATPESTTEPEAGRGYRPAGEQGRDARRSETSRAPLAARASPKSRGLARRLGISLDGITGTGPRGMIVASDVEQASVQREIKASPVARRVAAEAGLDLEGVAGTGPGGQIMRADVELALREPVARTPPAPTKFDSESRALSGPRAIIADRLSASWRESPHVTLTTEADATNLVGARQQATAELGEKVSYDALLVALVARALGEHPHVNVRLVEEGIVTLGDINIGVALDTDRGLLVPVVRDAGSKSLFEIQRMVAELAERALAGRSLPDDLAGGTFTITNLGVYDIDAFTPIINPPECAILGVGRIVAKPVADEGRVVVRDMMALSLSFDHRLLDGAPAARFLQRVRQLVERPFALAFGAK